MLSIQVRFRCPFALNALTFEQMSFGLFVYPSLVLAYLGQGARLIVDGDSVISNVFYNTIPGAHNGPLFWYVHTVRMAGLDTDVALAGSYTFSPFWQR